MLSFRWRSEWQKSLGLKGPVWGDDAPPIPEGSYKPYGALDDPGKNWIGLPLSFSSCLSLVLTAEESGSACSL